MAEPVPGGTCPSSLPYAVLCCAALLCEPVFSLSSGNMLLLDCSVPVSSPGPCDKKKARHGQRQYRDWLTGNIMTVGRNQPPAERTRDFRTPKPSSSRHCTAGAAHLGGHHQRAVPGPASRAGRGPHSSPRVPGRLLRPPGSGSGGGRGRPSPPPTTPSVSRRGGCHCHIQLSCCPQ